MNAFLTGTSATPSGSRVVPGPPKTKKRGGSPRRFAFDLSQSGSAQQLQHALLRLVGERQRGDRDRLPGGQRLAGGRFLVRIGQRQVGRAGLQHVDQVLVEVLADLHDRQVRTERGCLGAQRGRGLGQRRQHVIGGVVIQEVG